MRSGNYLFYLFTFLAFVCQGYNSLGQQINFNTGIYGFFDNREYFNYYENDQTIFGTRVSERAIIDINRGNEISLGLDGLYEFGSNLNSDYLKPIAYIHHKSNTIDMYLGSFYRMPIVEMPKILLNDTLQYYKPNIEGIYLAYNKKCLSQNIWIDWVSRQTKVDKEIFYIGGSGQFYYNKMFYKHDFIFTHYAHTSNVNTNEHIRDNGGIYSRIGCQTNKFLFCDSLIISAGGILSYDRTRGVTPLTYYKGLMTEFYLLYKSLGFRYTGYIGTGQVLITGEPIYKAKSYNRVDLIWNLFNRAGIEGEVEFSVHFINDFIDYSQRFTLRANLDCRPNFKPITN